MKFPSVRFSMAALASFMLVNGFFLIASQAAQKEQIRRASAIADSVDRHILEAQSALQNAAAGTRTELDPLGQTAPYFSDLIALPSDAEDLMPGGIFSNSQIRPDQSDLFDAPFLVLDPMTGDAGIFIAQPAAGSGIILGKLDPELLRFAITAGEQKHSQEVIYLADEKGTVLARTELEPEPSVTLGMFTGTPDDGSYTSASIIVQNAQTSSQAVARLRNANWYVITHRPAQGTVFPLLLSTFLVLVAATTVWAAADNRSSPEHPAALPILAVPAAQVIQSKPIHYPKDGEDRDERVLLEALRDTAAVLNSSLEFDEVMSRILDNVGKVVPHHSSNIMLIDKDGDTVRIVAARGYIPLGLQGYPERLRLSIQNTDTLRIMHDTGQPLVIPDTAENLRWHNIPETAWIRSYAAAPIMVKDRIIGFLSLNSPTAGFYQTNQENRLQAFADQAGIAIENARLIKELQQSNLELIKTYDITLQGWSKALELRDYETEGHSKRVVELTLKIAARSGIIEPELTHIRYGVLLHDIGKIGIPDAILFKPGPLSEEEWEVMRRHPQYALDILDSIPYLARSIDIPYGHHERWDGTGYPRGLMGEEIPLSARIFAVVDVWDGLRQSRPYHASWSFDEAVRYIKAQSGQQFDPQVVETFLQLLSES